MIPGETLRVYIATTKGPSEIQRLAEEDPDVSSVVCLNGTAQALPISPAYDAFVRKPTGVIEKTFGHGVFRADVAEPITDGQSWQLGFFLSHALKSQRRLAEKDQTAERVIWASGEVNHDLSVSPIAHMAEKLEASAELFSALSDAGIPVAIILHPDNADEVPKSLSDRVTITTLTNVADIQGLFGGGSKQPEVRPAAVSGASATADAAAASYPASPPTPPVSPDMDDEPPISQPWRFVGMGIGILLMVSLAFPFWFDLFSDPEELDIQSPGPAAPMFQQPNDGGSGSIGPIRPPVPAQEPKPVPQTGLPMDIPGSNPPVGPIQLAAFQRRAPEGQICSETIRGERTEIVLGDRGFRTDAGRDLCRLFVKADNVSDDQKSMLLELSPAIQRISADQPGDFKREFRFAEVVNPGRGIGMPLHRFWSLQRPGRLSVTIITLPAYSPLLQRWTTADTESRATVMADIRDAGGHVVVETLRLGRPKNRAAERFQ